MIINKYTYAAVCALSNIGAEHHIETSRVKQSNRTDKTLNDAVANIGVPVIESDHIYNVLMEEATWWYNDIKGMSDETLAKDYMYPRYMEMIS